MVQDTMISQYLQRLRAKSPAPFPGCRGSPSPELARSQPGTLDQAGHFGPYHAWIHGSLADPRTEATVGPSDDTFAAYQPRVGAEALRHHLRVFYIVGFRLDHTGDKDLILRQLHLLEELPFVGVARVGGFEGDPVW